MRSCFYFLPGLVALVLATPMARAQPTHTITDGMYPETGNSPLASEPTPGFWDENTAQPPLLNAMSANGMHFVLGLDGVDYGTWTVVLPQLSLFSVAELTKWHVSNPTSNLTELLALRAELLTAFPWLNSPEEDPSAGGAGTESGLTGIGPEGSLVRIEPEFQQYIATDTFNNFASELFNAANPDRRFFAVPQNQIDSKFFWPAVECETWYEQAPARASLLAYLWVPARVGLNPAFPPRSPEVLSVDRLLDVAIILRAPNINPEARNALARMPDIWRVGFRTRIQYMAIKENPPPATTPTSPTTQGGVPVPPIPPAPPVPPVTPPPLPPLIIDIGHIGTVFVWPDGPGGCVFQPVVLGPATGPGGTMVVSLPHSASTPIAFDFDGHGTSIADRASPIDSFLTVQIPAGVPSGTIDVKPTYLSQDVEWQGPPLEIFQVEIP